MMNLKRRFLGLNSVTSYHANKVKGQVRYDDAKETVSEIYIGRDEAPPAPKISNRLRRSRRFQEREDKLLMMLHDRYSVLDFDTNMNMNKETELTDISPYSTSALTLEARHLKAK
ncbi:hypothetical protein ACHAXN_012896 [Cyclotella atomus]|jgi:hypothetical protein